MAKNTKPDTPDKDSKIVLNEFPEIIQKTDGLPEHIHTEPQLWDEIFKKEALEMPFLLLPVISEVYGKTYPADTEIVPLGTEYSVERVVTRDISSIRSDSTFWIASRIYHFECEIDASVKIVKRVYEYDSQAALSYSERGTKEIPYLLQFPYSTVLFLEGGSHLSDHLGCELCMPVYEPYAHHTKHIQEKSIEYAVPAIKVQDYTLQEIRDKHLLILIPFTPIRFRALFAMQKKKQIYTPDNAKLELTNYFHEIILILNEAVETGYICELDRKDILMLLRKAMIRVFHEDKFLLEVTNQMTAPVLELERETIVRLQKELDAMRSEKDTATSEYNIIRSECDAVRIEYDAVKSEYDSVKSEYDSVKSEYDSVKSEYDSVKSECMEKDAIIKALTLENETLKAARHPFRNIIILGKRRRS